MAQTAWIPYDILTTDRVAETEHDTIPTLNEVSVGVYILWLLATQEHVLKNKNTKHLFWTMNIPTC